MNAEYDVIILGAGAAGLMCAAQAGGRGRRVLLIDHADQPGKKILISGGGRCNFTNIHTAPDRFLSANPHFARSALSRFTPHDFLALVESHNIAWHEKTLGQLFCDGSAKQIVNMLTAECEKGHVTLRCSTSVRHVSHGENGFTIETTPQTSPAQSASAQSASAQSAQTITAPSLVIATGGPAIPKIGASGFAYDLARQFGLKVVEPRPALVPLTLSGDDALFRELSGVAAEVIASCGHATFKEAALFTHRGLSGPAILQVSSYWRRGDGILINFLPDSGSGWLTRAKQETPRATMRSILRASLPSRLADALTNKLAIFSLPLVGPLANIPDAALKNAENQLAGWRFLPTGSEGFAKAEVTIGGVSTAELSSKTMEAKRVPGLYIIGEAVDVTGWLGGYNFQWAWASAWAAAQAL